MNWLIHYDVAAIIICLLLLIVFMCYRSFPTIQTKLYNILLLVSLISIILDLCTVFSISYWEQCPLALNYFLNICYLLTFNCIPLLYCCFIQSLIRKKRSLRRLPYIFFFLPYMVSALLIITTPVSHLIFYFAKDTGYAHQPLFFLLYFNSVLYLMISLKTAFQYRKHLNFIQQVSVCFYTISSTSVVIIQFFLSNYLLTGFAIAVSLFFIYLTLQNPLEFNDSITNLFNRSAFVKMTGEYIDAQKPFKVLAIQISGLKFISEKFGVRNGYSLIKEVADYLHALLPNYYIFHISMGQFTILLPSTQDETITTNAILSRFEQPFFLNHMEVTLWSYLCCFSYPENVKKLNEVLDTIDYSLITAQNQKRNSLVYGSDEMLAKKNRECAIVQILEHAITNQSFEVYYQPIYSVSQQAFTSAEALVRLKDKELGYIPPDEFIPIAEQNGLIIKLGEIVFHKVCAFIQKHQLWNCELELFRVNVNLSVIQCMQEDLACVLLQIIDFYHIPYASISLEITETVAANSGECLLSHMQQLAEKGILFSLDDYGTGYSNTANLMSNPYTVVKLDKSMIWAAQSNPKAMISLKHTIAMIQDLNMKVLAEGIETTSQRDLLESMHCDYFQGYFYSKPLPEENFLDVLSKS
ncbi:MAG: EAL domain-containing protein [Lachnospiraceae bacterium]